MTRSSLRIRISFVVLGMLCLAWSAPAAADNYAFLVAVQDYNVKSLKPLRFTRNDIEEFSKILRTSGFKPENIVVMTDKPEQLRYAAMAEQIRKQLTTLLAGLDENDTLVVAFAGHGVQYEGDPKNYFCPIDADLDDPKHEKLIAISEIYEKLKECPASRKLLVVDACRKEPQSDIARSRDTVKLKSVTRPQTEAVPKGVVALFSCAAGQEAFEWPEFKHGIFFHHFLRGWEGAAASQGDQQVTLDQVVAYARKNTQTFARLNLDVPQTPQMKSDFQGTWVLRTLAVSETPSKTVATSLPLPPLPRLPVSTGNSTPPAPPMVGNSNPPAPPTLPLPTVLRGSAPGAGAPEGFTNGIGMKLRLIPKGEFTMGAPRGEDTFSKLYNEQLHRVVITQPFYLAIHEVTQEQFQKIMNRNPSAYSASGKSKGMVAGLNTDRFPVEQVTWFDAVEFCNKLSKIEGLEPYYRLTGVEWNEDSSIKKAEVTVLGGRGYRLPTEAEWEYACRAGTKTPFHFGSSNNGRESNMSGNYPYGTTTVGPDLKHPTTVGQYGPNQFGLYDMHGNVFEWCQDLYDSDYYPTSPAQDPTGPKFVDRYGGSRVIRGGSFWNDGNGTRSAFRLASSPDSRIHTMGFRVAGGAPAKGKAPAPPDDPLRDILK